jgi:deferrochelatase/peroxidase EfeB
VECGGAKHLYFVYEARNEKEFKDFMNAGEDKLQQYWLAWDLIVHIEQTIKDKLQQTTRNTPYDFLFSETSIKQNRLMLYVVYR